MINIFLFVLGVIGMTNIIVDGDIFEYPRRILKKILPGFMYKLFECYQCCGTWCGFICGSLAFGLDWKLVFLSGCAGSFLATWAATYITYLEAKTILSVE